MKVFFAGLLVVTLAIWFAPGDERAGLPDEPRAQLEHAPIVAPRSPVVSVVPGKLRLEGQAIDAKHQPIAGATITLAGARTVITEQDGSFAFDGLAAGTYSLGAERDGMYGEAADEVLDDTSEPVMITMRWGPTLVVRVVAQDGTPIRDAKVSESRHDRVTNADGVVMFRGLELGDTYVHIHAIGYAPQRLRVELGEQPEVTVDRTVRLDRGVVVEGIVVDDREQRVAGARVTLEAPGDRWSETVDADEAGRFRFAAIGPGRHGVRASGDRHIETATLIVELDGTRPRTDLVVRVHAGAEVAGIVVDAQGKPVKGATVRVASSSAESDETGRFLVQGLEPGTHDFHAETALAGSAVAQITVARGARANVRIQVVPSSIAGIVRDVHGQPVEDVFVWLKETTADHRRWATTDETGRFDVEGIPPGVYEVTAERRHEPSRETSVVLATVRTPARTLALVVPDAWQIAGRVIMDGAPVTHYGVSVTEDAERTGSPDVVNARDGRFARTDITPGTWAVVIAGPHFGKKVITGIVVGDRTVELGDIVVERGRTLDGRVVDERGRPLANATVEVSRDGHSGDASLRAVMDGGRVVRTDRDGRYQIAGLAADAELRISATHARGMSRAARLPVDARTVDLVIEGAGSITGHVDGIARQYVAYAESIADDTERYAASIDAAGGFAFDRLPAGDYTLSVYGDNTLAPRRVTVRAGTSTAVVFELTPRPE